MTTTATATLPTIQTIQTIKEKQKNPNRQKSKTAQMMKQNHRTKFYQMRYSRN